MDCKVNVAQKSILYGFGQKRVGMCLYIKGLFLGEGYENCGTHMFCNQHIVGSVRVVQCDQVLCGRQDS